MLSRAALLSAFSVKKSAPAVVGILNTCRSLHTGKPSLAPVPPLPEYPGKVRHGFIPEEFFQFLYPKTGVTGPYMLGTGLLVYLLSKEMYVINHETVYMISFGLLTVYAVKKYGPTLAEYIDQINEEKIAEIQNVKDTEIKFLENSIKEEKEEQWRVEGRHHLFEAKRNNVAVILEANYRERLLNVYNEVKKRLDYQVALQHLLRHREQEHMINWVEKNVVQSITAQQQKESIAKCISDLKLLSKKAQAAV